MVLLIGQRVVQTFRAFFKHMLPSICDEDAVDF
jgi:hypothetical protein